MEFRRVLFRSGHARQRIDGGRQVLPPAPLRDHPGLPAAAAPPAHQLLRRGQVMGVLRVERDAPTGIAARVGGVAWRDFDLQLFVYAALLATLGLTMAYSNTTAQLGADALQGGTTFVRGIIWAMISKDRKSTRLNSSHANI